MAIGVGTLIGYGQRITHDRPYHIVCKDTICHICQHHFADIGRVGDDRGRVGVGAIQIATLGSGIGQTFKFRPRFNAAIWVFVARLAGFIT